MRTVNRSNAGTDDEDVYFFVEKNRPAPVAEAPKKTYLCKNEIDKILLWLKRKKKIKSTSKPT